MKAIPHILSKVYCEPWLILPDKHRAIQESLERHLASLHAEDGDPEDDDMQNLDQVDPVEPPYELRSNGNALIKVTGIMGKRLSFFELLCGGYDVDDLVDGVKTAMADPMVRRLFIDYDTPGGMSTGIQEAGDYIAQASAQKPIISYTEMQCCSAGTWLASRSSLFYASASSRSGSIGAYAAYLDQSRRLEQMGITVNPIVSGKYKIAGAPFKPMTEDERSLLQASMDKLHGQFKAAVNARGRKLPDEMMQGQVFDGEEAAEIGLTHGIVSSLDELVDDFS